MSYEIYKSTEIHRMLPIHIGYHFCIRAECNIFLTKFLPHRHEVIICVFLDISIPRIGQWCSRAIEMPCFKEVKDSDYKKLSEIIFQTALKHC